MKTILITGSTDGLGLATAEALVAEGHRVLIHGRNARKLEQAQKQLERAAAGGQVKTSLADLARLQDVDTLAKNVAEKHDRLDVLINNAGVFNTPTPRTPDGLDVRFVVNTIAPYLLTRRLLPRIAADGRVVNLSSAAQAPVDLRHSPARSNSPISMPTRKANSRSRCGPDPSPGSTKDADRCSSQ